MDETRAPVLDPGKRKTKTGYFWALARDEPKSITLIGHTDRRGDSNYNLGLSERRARAVLGALVEWQGLDPTLFQVVGRGEEELLSDGLTEMDHARDRRVVVVLN